MQSDNQDKQSDIFFYGQNRANGQFSNFYPCSFQDEQCIPYNCSEQYFMFKKVQFFEPDNNELLKAILKETNPGKIKAYGSKKFLKTFDETKWNEVKLSIMENALRLKFNQNEQLKLHLLNTCDANIYEASHRDKIWGIGFGVKQALETPKHNFGQNLLGKSLMKIRNEIRENQKNPKTILELKNKGIIDEEVYIQLIKLKGLNREYLSIIFNELENL